MPESPTLRVITTLSLPARSLTSPYPSSCSSRTPSSSQSLFCSTAQPHLALPPPCLTPYPHHIVFRFPSPTPRSFPPSSISPSPSPSSSNSAHAYISSSFSLSPSSQSISSPLNLPSLHPEKTSQRDGRDNGSKGGMKIGRDKYPSVRFPFFFLTFTFPDLPLFPHLGRHKQMSNTDANSFISSSPDSTTHTPAFREQPPPSHPLTSHTSNVHSSLTFGYYYW